MIVDGEIIDEITMVKIKRSRDEEREDNTEINEKDMQIKIGDK